MVAISYEDIVKVPKVLLHDHLDGGLRPATIVELAAEVGHELPTTDAGGARRLVRRGRRTPARWSATWRRSRTRSRSCRPPSALRRVARECAQDLAADGVVYAEVRFAPEQHLEQGLTLDEVVEAVRHRVPGGQRAGRRGRHPDPDRHAAHRDAARRPLAGDRRAGRAATATPGWSASTSPAPRRASRPPGTWTRSSTSSGRTPTSPSTPARRSGCRRSGRRSSGAAPTGSATACGSSTTSPRRRRPPVLGRLAAYVRDKRIPLEMCPSSNVQTGAAASIAEHPIGLLRRPAVPGHRQHRQPADERHLDDPRDGAAGARRSATAGRTCSGSPSTR